MALYYHWAFDTSSIGVFSVPVVDDDGSRTATVTAAVYCHTDISTIVSTISDLATAVQTALNAGATGTPYTVTWANTTGYTIAYSGTASALDFSDTAAGTVNLRHAMGFLNVSLNVGAGNKTSDVRPYYLIIPVIQARSGLTDEQEPDGIAEDALADDGSSNTVSKDTTEINIDWTQVAEIETTPTTAFGDGTPPYIRQADAGTNAGDVPWTYQHAWRHMRAAYHPFVTIDGGTVENAVCEMRAEGMSLKPQRWSGEDQPVWSIAFKVRLLGRV